MTDAASAEMQMVARELAKNRLTDRTDQSIEDMRKAMEQMVPPSSVSDGVTIESVDIALSNDRTIPARWHSAPSSSKRRVILYLHGGGYALGNMNVYKDLMSRLAITSNARVLGIDYRLAPEHPFPAGLLDARAAYEWLLQQGIKAQQIAVAGDSAGGGLTLALLMSLRDGIEQQTPLAQPACAVIFSPWTDLLATGDSMTTRADSDPMLNIEGINQLAGYYCGDADMRNALISPIYGNLTGLPPILAQVGENEVLLDDAVRLQPMADKAGIALQLQVFAGAFHVFQIFSNIPEAASALANVAEFLDQQIK